MSTQAEPTINTALIEKDFGILTNDPAVQKRALAICEEFKYSYECWNDLDSFMESSQRPKMVLAHITNPDGPIKASEMGQLVRSFTTESFLVCITRNILGKEEAAFSKKSGCDLVLMEDEVIKTGKLEFVCTQILRSQYIPIKPSDLTINTTITFDLFHLLPMRGKFLRFAHAGDFFDEKKFAKSKLVGEFYIERDSSPNYNKYIQETADKSAAGLEKRCRSEFLNLFSEFSQLAFQLTNQSEHASFGDGQKLLNQCTQACKKLIETLGESGQAWRIINNSSIGEFGSLERAPAVASYSGLFALQIGMNKIELIMLSALLTDLGLLFISPTVLRKIRELNMMGFTYDERVEYERYPSLSLDIILNRKLSIPENQRSWIVATQETADGKGFPKKLTGLQAPKEARLISFCREFDRRTLIRMGQLRQDPQDVLKKMLLDSPELITVFGEDLINDLKPLVQ